MTEVLENLQQLNGPEVPSSIFNNHPEATYWIGKVADLGQSSLPEYYNALTKFRAETYLRLGFIAMDQLDTEGRDIDKDELRSTSFMVVKKSEHNSIMHTSVVGSARLICKGVTGDPLPIERTFPEIFDKDPLSNKTVEISRFISRDSEEINRHMVSLALIRTLTYECIETIADSGHCMLEKPFLRLLEAIGIPIEVVGAPKDIPEQGGVLYPVKIDNYQVFSSIKNKKDKYKIIDLQRFFDDEGKGIGYYNNSLDGVKND
jgi:N-acyl-L-homoserine lactone synthetase